MLPMVRDELVRDLAASAPCLSAVTRWARLDKGHSEDEKHLLYVGDTPAYLLRLSGSGWADQRQREFLTLGRQHARGLPCPEPVLFRRMEDQLLCATVTGFIPGDCAEDVLPTLRSATQRDIGLQAGALLRRLHELAPTEPTPDWAERRWRQYLHILRLARYYGIEFSRQAEVEAYAAANAPLLDHASERFRHEDYHPGNLIVRGTRVVGVIDFCRCTWGDPVEDTYKLPLWACRVSIDYARGQVDGYYDEEVPDGFWPRHAFYVALHMHGGLVWDTMNCPERLPLRRERVDWTVSQYDFHGGGPPRWYA